MKRLISCGVVVCMSVGGCTSAPVPIRAPQVGELYKAPPALALQGCTTVTTPPVPITVCVPARNAAYTLATEAAKYGKDVDNAAEFKIWNDLTALGLLAGAGIGGLTNAHSDLYKSVGALLGLSIGTDIYLKPDEQRGIYLNAAEAASCSARQMHAISMLTTDVEAVDIEAVRAKLPEYERAAKTVLYSTDLQTTLANLKNPFLAAKVIDAGIQAEANTVAVENVLDFLANIENVEFSTRKSITLYTISEIYKIAYKRDEALAKIADLSITPSELLDGFNTAGLSAGMSAFVVGDPGVENLNKNMRALISAINSYHACAKVVSGQAEVE